MKFKFPLFILAGLVLLVLPLIHATLPSIEQNICIDLPQRCDNCTWVNLTKIQIFPSGEVILSGQYEMTKSGTDYNYTFCNTSEQGTYIYTACGDDDGIIVCASDDFKVTTTGGEQTTSEALGSSIYLILMICLTFLFFYGGFKLSESEILWVLGVFFIVLGLFFLTYIMWLGYLYQINYVGIDGNIQVVEILFYIFLFIMVSGLLTTGVLLFKHYKKVTNAFKPPNFEDGWDKNNFE